MVAQRRRGRPGLAARGDELIADESRYPFAGLITRPHHLGIGHVNQEVDGRRTPRMDLLGAGRGRVGVQDAELLLQSLSNGQQARGRGIGPIGVEGLERAG
jgi:hypothetical protein